MDRPSDTASLTYQELAERLGIDLLSARRRVLRSKWQKTKGNDGRVRVSVPLEVIAIATVPTTVPTTVAPTVVPTVPTTDVPTQPPGPPPVVLTEEALSRLLARVGDIANLRERAAIAETRAELAEAARQVAEAERDTARADLATWAAGNPIARAWRAFRYQRGR